MSCALAATALSSWSEEILDGVFFPRTMLRRPLRLCEARSAGGGSAPEHTGEYLSEDGGGGELNQNIFFLWVFTQLVINQLTVDLVIRWKEADIRQGDPSSIPIVKLHHDAAFLLLLPRTPCKQIPNIQYQT